MPRADREIGQQSSAARLRVSLQTPPLFSETCAGPSRSCPSRNIKLRRRFSAGPMISTLSLTPWCGFRPGGYGESLSRVLQRERGRRRHYGRTPQRHLSSSAFHHHAAGRRAHVNPPAAETGMASARGRKATASRKWINRGKHFVGRPTVGGRHHYPGAALEQKFRASGLFSRWPTRARGFSRILEWLRVCTRGAVGDRQ